MSETYMKYVRILHSIFDEQFIEAYKGANSRKRRKVLPYLQAIHRRWYYATLVEHTPFSPANLMEVICRHYGESSGLYPLSALRTPTKVTGLDVSILSYTADCHPAVVDMRRLVEYCTPHVDLCEEECFTDAQALEVSELLSLNDPHYASFLLELAIWMKLLNRMPSLHVQRMQVSKKCEEIMALSDRELLLDMVEATIALSTYGLRNSMPMPEHIFTESFVRSLLTSPLETDEIFARVFEVMGYELEDLLEISNMPATDGIPPEILGYDMELLSGTFVMGIVLDRFFFTPFGHYLRLIRPMYAIPFGLDEEVKDYVNVCEDPQEAFVAFFAPCSSYTLTDLGLEILNVTPTEDNYFNAADLPFDTMQDTIFANEQAFATFVELARHLSPLALQNAWAGAEEILTFRVRLESEPSVWMHYQVPDNMTLQHLYDEAVQYFGLKHNEEFSFFHDKTENRFAEFPSAKRANRAKNPRKTACQTPLSELDFDNQKNLILAAYNQAKPFAHEASTVRLQLEYMKTTPPNADEYYPRVSRMSKDMKVISAERFEDEWDFPML